MIKSLLPFSKTSLPTLRVCRGKPMTLCHRCFRNLATDSRVFEGMRVDHTAASLRVFQNPPPPLTAIRRRWYSTCPRQTWHLTRWPSLQASPSYENTWNTPRCYTPHRDHRQTSARSCKDNKGPRISYPWTHSIRVCSVYSAFSHTSEFL